MDHHEEQHNNDRSLPLQEQLHLQQQQQHSRRILQQQQQPTPGRTQRQPPPHQWMPQRPGYPIAQQQPPLQPPQQPPPSTYARRPYGNPGAAGGIVPAADMDVTAPLPQQEYPPQRMAYPPPPMHQSVVVPPQGYPASAATGAAGYPQQQHYQQPPPPQLYHHAPHQQQPVSVQQQRQSAAVQQQLAIQQSIHMQQQAQHQHMAATGAVPMMDHHPASAGLQPPQGGGVPYVQPTVGRLPSDRPLVKLSVSLIDTYKQINKVYYEERDARRAARAAQKEKTKGGQGTNNNGWDDENYDYIVTSGEMFYGRYVIKERIGKGSFGQVVRATDTETQKDVAIKIIKSKKPFLMQAKTEIELLTQLCEKDAEDQFNVVRLLTHFMFRNHQCLVFEILSLNLYELLKNTQFGGVSLNLIRKFAKQILKSLSFLARSDVDIIHCDLKPENILLRHPKRSGVKVIDFGSSCRSNKRMYSYIQSRFYRSPEVMLGLPYSVAIDVWSLGCILAEMHTGEPLFSGSDQFDQMQKIVKILGMVPYHMIDRAGEQQKKQFFERTRTASGNDEWAIRQTSTTAASGNSKSSSSATTATSVSTPQSKQTVVPSINPVASLTEVICAESNKKKRAPASEAGDSQRNYELFVDLIHRMLTYDPEDRIKPEDALNHGFIRSGEQSQSSSPYPGSQASTRRSDASSTEGASRPRKDAPTKRAAASQQQQHPPR